MNQEIEKIMRLLRRDAVRGFKALQDFLQKLKEADKNEVRRAIAEIKRLEKMAQELFLQKYYAKSELSSEAFTALEKGSNNLFKNAGTGVSVTTAINKALGFIESGDIDDAVLLVKKSARTARFRAETIVNTVRLSRSRSATIKDAKPADKFRYTGPSFKTRQFCRERIGQIFTLAEIEAMNNGQGLPVKEFCGGYNCKHRWVKII